jgi:phosphatidylserine/phosphatidylglycerophosphate/cardiolipin synthase-like enzyme
VGIVAAVGAEGATTPGIEFVETTPIETNLDRLDVPDAFEVWPEMIRSATHTIDWIAFYVSGQPGSRLDPVLTALEDAASRGVTVRILADAGFYHRTYPEDLDHLDETDGIAVRLLDVGDTWGGVLHAKGFILDGDEAFVGSQNTDWRSLEHIVEMGVRVRLPGYVDVMSRIFEADWALAAPLPAGSHDEAHRPRPSNRRAVDPGPYRWTDARGDTLRAWSAMSPQGHLPHPDAWDLPRMVEWIDSAADTVRATMLTYRPPGRDGAYFADLDTALRRAATRGVRVQLLVADWSKRRPTLDHLQSLACIPGIEVRMATIPAWSGGFIPFARVIHAKFFTVDGQRFWLGTSNWERGYFHDSRNLGILVESPAHTRSLDESFDALWTSVHAYPVEPGRTFEVPRIGP